VVAKTAADFIDEAMKPAFSSTNLPVDLKGKWIPLGPSPEPEQAMLSTARAERGHVKGDKTQ
jgi:hypothetical protein